MTAYYNEHDPFAAAWLRELIKENLIAPGEVDERSIAKVEAIDLKGFSQHHFFAGIGVWSYALRRAGWPDDRPVWTGSCPCQPFSLAGKGDGGTDDRHLWPHWSRLIGECKPHTIFGEQVESAIRHGWIDLVSDDLEAHGYAVGPVSFPACSVGAFHIRQRLYFVADAGCERSERGKPGEMGSAASDRSGETRQQRLRDAADASDETGKLADATEPRRTEAREHRGGSPLFPARPEQRERTGGLADAHAGDHRPIKPGARRRGESSDGGDQGSVGNTTKRGQRVRGSASRDAGRPALAIEAGDVGLAERERLQRHAGDGNEGDQPGRIGADQARPTTTAGRAFRWHLCSDGKYRPVPVEPALFPLAPRSAGRVGLLRGAGNAIHAGQAQAFIEAYLGGS